MLSKCSAGADVGHLNVAPSSAFWGIPDAMAKSDSDEVTDSCFREFVCGEIGIGR